MHYFSSQHGWVSALLYLTIRLSCLSVVCIYFYIQEVNGKEVQISLTGFMEKNTGKFMKELWTLLLSAQKTDSGVPQQFLDAKEEETRKKQVWHILQS